MAVIHAIDARATSDADDTTAAHADADAGAIRMKMADSHTQDL
jgi:hypothetical protein